MRISIGQGICQVVFTQTNLEIDGLLSGLG